MAQDVLINEHELPRHGPYDGISFELMRINLFNRVSHERNHHNENHTTVSESVDLLDRKMIDETFLAFSATVESASSALNLSFPVSNTWCCNNNNNGRI